MPFLSEPKYRFERSCVIGVGDRVRGQYRLESARSVRASLQSGVNGGGR
jgi:hypothetical protein